MNRTLALALSVVFHPLLIPTYLFGLVLYGLPQSMITFPAESRWVIMAIVFFTTFIVPGLGTYFMYRNGFISSMHVENRPERNLPFFFTTVCFAVTSYLFYQEQIFDRLLFYIMFLVTLSVFLVYLISFRWKISAHSVGLGGALGILFFLHANLPENFLLYFLVAAVLVVGAVMSARLALQAHTPAEVYTGFLLGFLVGLGIWPLIS
ncbi:MAG: hypothetical protein ACO1OF_19360 [Adhaeribacter sp.]